MPCPECDFLMAEVKTDKNEHPYRYCPNCNTQTFTRGEPKRIANMLKKMQPVESQLQDIKNEKEPQKKIEAQALGDNILKIEKPIKTGFSIGDL